MTSKVSITSRRTNSRLSKRDKLRKTISQLHTVISSSTTNSNSTSSGDGRSQQQTHPPATNTTKSTLKILELALRELKRVRRSNANAPDGASGSASGGAAGGTGGGTGQNSNNRQLHDTGQSSSTMTSLLLENSGPVSHARLLAGVGPGDKLGRKPSENSSSAVSNALNGKSSSEGEEVISLVSMPVLEKRQYTFQIGLQEGEVLSVSLELLRQLHYPDEFWRGCLFTNFIQDEDINQFVGFLGALRDSLSMPCSTTNSAIGAQSFTMTTTENVIAELGAKQGGSRKTFRQQVCVRLRMCPSLPESYFASGKESRHIPFLGLGDVTPTIQDSRRMAADNVSFQTRTTNTSSGIGSDLSSSRNSAQVQNQVTLSLTRVCCAYAAANFVPKKNRFATKLSPLCKFSGKLDPCVVSFLGYMPQDLAFQCIFDIIHPEDLHKVYDAFHEVRHESGHWVVAPPVRWRCCNGAYLLIQTNLRSRLQKADNQTDSRMTSTDDSSGSLSNSNHQQAVSPPLASTRYLARESLNKESTLKKINSPTTITASLNKIDHQIASAATNKPAAGNTVIRSANIGWGNQVPLITSFPTTNSNPVSNILAIDCLHEVIKGPEYLDRFFDPIGKGHDKFIDPHQWHARLCALFDSTCAIVNSTGNELSNAPVSVYNTVSDGMTIPLKSYQCQYQQGILYGDSSNLYQQRSVEIKGSDTNTRDIYEAWNHYSHIHRFLSSIERQSSHPNFEVELARIQRHATARGVAAAANVATAASGPGNLPPVSCLNNMAARRNAGSLGSSTVVHISDLEHAAELEIGQYPEHQTACQPPPTLPKWNAGTAGDQLHVTATGTPVAVSDTKSSAAVAATTTNENSANVGGAATSQILSGQSEPVDSGCLPLTIDNLQRHTRLQKKHYRDQVLCQIQAQSQLATNQVAPNSPPANSTCGPSASKYPSQVESQGPGLVQPPQNLQKQQYGAQQQSQHLVTSSGESMPQTMLPTLSYNFPGSGGIFGGDTGKYLNSGNYVYDTDVQQGQRENMSPPGAGGACIEQRRPFHNVHPAGKRKWPVCNSGSSSGSSQGCQHNHPLAFTGCPIPGPCLAEGRPSHHHPPPTHGHFGATTTHLFRRPDGIFAPSTRRSKRIMQHYHTDCRRESDLGGDIGGGTGFMPQVAMSGSAAAARGFECGVDPLNANRGEYTAPWLHPCQQQAQAQPQPPHHHGCMSYTGSGTIPNCCSRYSLEKCSPPHCCPSAPPVQRPLPWDCSQLRRMAYVALMPVRDFENTFSSSCRGSEQNMYGEPSSSFHNHSYSNSMYPDHYDDRMMAQAHQHNCYQCPHSTGGNIPCQQYRYDNSYGRRDTHDYSVSSQRQAGPIEGGGMRGGSGGPCAFPPDQPNQPSAVLTPPEVDRYATGVVNGNTNGAGGYCMPPTTSLATPYPSVPPTVPLDRRRSPEPSLVVMAAGTDLDVAEFQAQNPFLSSREGPNEPDNDDDNDDADDNDTFSLGETVSSSFIYLLDSSNGIGLGGGGWGGDGGGSRAGGTKSPVMPTSLTIPMATTSASVMQQQSANRQTIQQTPTLQQTPPLTSQHHLRNNRQQQQSTEYSSLTAKKVNEVKSRWDTEANQIGKPAHNLESPSSQSASSGCKELRQPGTTSSFTCQKRKDQRWLLGSHDMDKMAEMRYQMEVPVSSGPHASYDALWHTQCQQSDMMTRQLIELLDYQDEGDFLIPPFGQTSENLSLFSEDNVASRSSSSGSRRGSPNTRSQFEQNSTKNSDDSKSSSVEPASSSGHDSSQLSSSEVVSSEANSRFSVPDVVSRRQKESPQRSLEENTPEETSSPDTRLPSNCDVTEGGTEATISASEGISTRQTNQNVSSILVSTPHTPLTKRPAFSSEENSPDRASNTVANAAFTTITTEIQDKTEKDDDQHPNTVAPSQEEKNPKSTSSALDSHHSNPPPLPVIKVMAAISVDLDAECGSSDSGAGSEYKISSSGSVSDQEGGQVFMRSSSDLTISDDYSR